MVLARFTGVDMAFFFLLSFTFKLKDTEVFHL